MDNMLKNIAMAIGILSTVATIGWGIVDRVSAAAYIKAKADIIIDQADQRDEELTTSIMLQLELDRCKRTNPE